MAKIHSWSSIHCIFNLTAKTWPRFQVPWSGSVTAVCATGPRSCPTSPPSWARTATVRSTKTTSTASCGHAPKLAPDVHRNDPEITVSTVKVLVLCSIHHPSSLAASDQRISSWLVKMFIYNYNCVLGMQDNSRSNSLAKNTVYYM